VTDRIDVEWSTTSHIVIAAFDTHGDIIASEVLARTMTEVPNNGEPFTIGEATGTLSIRI
jgi:hypothetical protein